MVSRFLDVLLVQLFFANGGKVSKMYSDPEKAAERQAMINKRGGNKRQSGFIAQEVEAAAKELGYEFSGVDAPKNEDDLYGLRYSAFVVPLVKAIQEQQVLIEEQQKAIKELQDKLGSSSR